MEPAPGSVTVTMSGATFPGGQGAVGWGRCRQDLAPPVLLGRPADADLAPLGASSRQSGGRGQRRDYPACSARWRCGLVSASPLRWSGRGCARW
jgi:hypothetical protein